MILLSSRSNVGGPVRIPRGGKMADERLTTIRVGGFPYFRVSNEPKSCLYDLGDYHE